MSSPTGHPRTLEQLLQAAREDERRRCARELHDDTLQSLAALRVQLAAASRSDEVETLRAAITTAVQEVGREIGNLRALITDLRPAALDELGLGAALRSLFERAFTAYGLRVQSRVELGEPARDPELEITIYRVVQEALTNAARHGQAGRAVVTVTERGGEIDISILDDGSGFDLTAGRTGFGLTGMRERVALVGGELAIRSSPAGTGIRVVLPNAQPAAHATLSLMNS